MAIFKLILIYILDRPKTGAKIGVKALETAKTRIEVLFFLMRAFLASSFLLTGKRLQSIYGPIIVFN